MNKNVAIVGAILGSVAGAAGAAYYALFRRPLAQTDGDLRLPGLHHAVEVIRDEWGVPHVYAQDRHDLFYAQGFLHAQDRFFQMEFGRRLGAGRLAEVLGPPAVDADRWMRVIGLRRVAEKEFSLLQKDTRALMVAYASGVNAVIDRGRLPIEFSLLRYRPERWQVVDSLSWIKVMQWTLSVNWEQELLRAQLIARLGQERAASLEAPNLDDGPTVLPPDVDWSHIGAGALSRADSARPFTGPPTEAGLGSNNWVVDGSRSASGAPLLASDMHLQLGLPSIWYENHLCTEGFDVVGLSFPGLPGVVAGHNGRVAWSFTAGLTDTQDLYIERLNPDNPHQYEFEGAWHDAELLREEIVVKGKEPVVEKVLITRHGPLIDGLIPEETGEPVALRWTAHDPADMVSLLFDLCQVNNCSEFHQLMQRWAGPVQNVVYADVTGNIGYTLVGNTPIRAEGHDGRVPVPGWTGAFEWQGYVPFEHWPHTMNPAAGLVITANAKPVSDDYPYFLGHAWLPGYRSARIHELLDDAYDLTVADFCRIQMDLTSVLARRIGRHLAGLDLNSEPCVATFRGLESSLLDHVLSLFKDWDGELSADSPAAAVYQVFIRRMLYNLFEAVAGDVASGSKLADRFVGQGPHPTLAPTSLFGANGRVLLEHVLDTPASVALSHQARDAITSQSLREAIQFLKWHLGPEVMAWQWGDLHQLTYAHPLGQVSPLDKLFNRGPYPIGGDDSTIWATGAYYHNLHGDRMVGPACRFVVDLGDLGRSRSVNAPGQSGQPGSRHYADRIRDWFQGEYRPMLYHRHEIVARARARLELLP